MILAGFAAGLVSAILSMMGENDWTRVLGWPGYKVYRHEIDEAGKRLKLWVRRKRGNKHLACSGCGQLVRAIAASYEREVRDLPCFEYRTTVVIELYRVRCPDCGVKAEKVPLLPGKAPFSKRFEEAVGQACESAAASRVARQFGLPASTVRAIDQRYLARWAGTRRKPALRQMGVDEIFVGKKQKFITVVSNLETGEPLWFGSERKKETLDEFFSGRLSAFQRGAIRAACVDMWEPFRLSIEQWLPQCRIVYGRGRGAPGGVLSQGRPGAGTGEGQTLAATHPLGTSDHTQEAAAQCPVRSEPQSDEGLPAEGEPGPTVELSLRGRDAALPEELDRSTALAAAQAHGEAG